MKYELRDSILEKYMFRYHCNDVDYFLFYKHILLDASFHMKRESSEYMCNLNDINYYEL